MQTENRPEEVSRLALNQGGARPPGGRQGGAPGRNGGGAAPGGVVGMLHVIGGNDRGKAHPLTKPETSIGRGADQDCILADIAVSRRHVVVAIEGARYRLKDLGSGNGSLLNGTRTDTAILNDGDQVEIGNTLLRFEHAPSRPITAAPAGPMRADAGASTMMGDAVQFPMPQSQARNPANFPGGGGAPIADPFGSPSATPSDAIRMPPPSRPALSPLPAPLHTGAHSASGGGLLDTTAKKVAVFGTIGLIVLLGGAVVATKVFGGPNAKELFEQGKKAYVDGNYDGAKKLFADSQTAKADPETARYLQQCDVEIHARGALKTAQKMSEGKQWDQELKTLDTIDKASAAFEDAEKLRKAAIPNAVAADLNDARQAGDDTETALAKVAAALELDPDNEEALDLDKKLKAGGAKTVAAKSEAKPSHEARPSHEERAEAVAVKEKSKSTHQTAAKRSSGDDDDELASVSSAGGAVGDVLSIKGAGGPYRAKDFNGTATAIRLAAKNEKGKNSGKMIELAAQVSALGTVYAKAEADKGKNAAGALQEYQQAMTIDARIGKATHASYFRGQLGKLAQSAAEQAFQQQKFDTAYDDVKTAQKYGGSDGGVGAKLKAKASDLNNKAAGMQKSNLNGAKALWRMVVKIVPPTDAAYATAYKNLNSATQQHKDDDEE